MTKRNIFALSALFVLILAFSSSAFADTLNLTLSDPIQSATPGSTVSFTATASAPSTNGATIFLNADNFNVDSPLTLDDDGFFFGFPYSLDPGDSFTGLLFTVEIPVDAALDTYNGFFEVLGGADGGSSDILSTVTFQINTASANVVPEPSSILLFATGCLGLIFMVGGQRHYH